MEENKTIGTAEIEKLSEEALARAAGGCVLTCDYECVDYRILMFDNETRTYQAFRCKNCGAEHFYRMEGGWNEPSYLVEVSREEYNFFCKKK